MKRKRRRRQTKPDGWVYRSRARQVSDVPWATARFVRDVWEPEPLRAPVRNTGTHGSKTARPMFLHNELPFSLKANKREQGRQNEKRDTLSEARGWSRRPANDQGATRATPKEEAPQKAS